MAIYDKTEFLRLCGLDPSIKSNRDKFSVWISGSRKKIILNKDGLVDDSIPQNRDWLLRQSDIAKKGEDNKPEHVEKEIPKLKTDAPAGNIYELDKKIKTQQLEKLQVDTRLQLLKEEKIRGEVLPVDLIKTIFTVHSQSILTSFKDSLEDILIGISKKCDMSSENLAKSRELMINSLNNAVDKSVDTSKRQLKAIIEEFSIKKEVGEHE